MKTFALSTALVAALTTSTVQADDFHHHGTPGFNYRHVDELAAAVMRQAGAVAREARPMIYNGPTFRHLYDDAMEMYRLADHIHDLAHHYGNPYHIRADVDKLDRLFHHVEELAAALRTAYGHNHIGGHGFDIHVGHGGWTEHQLNWLQTTLAQMGGTLHHLQDATRAYVPVVTPAPVAPSVLRPTYQTRRGSSVIFRSGNNRIGFRLNLN